MQRTNVRLLTVDLGLFHELESDTILGLAKVEDLGAGLGLLLLSLGRRQYKCCNDVTEAKRV